MRFLLPIENYKETSREVYLPKVKVGQTYGQSFDGGKTVVVEADIQIPILSKQVKR